MIFSFYVNVDTVLPCDIKLRGETDKIMSLAHHIPGSFPYLFVSELASAVTDLHVSVKCEETKITFSIISGTVADTELRFNYRDMDAVTDQTLYYIYTVLDYVKTSLDCQQNG